MDYGGPREEDDAPAYPCWYYHVDCSPDLKLGYIRVHVPQPEVWVTVCIVVQHDSPGDTWPGTIDIGITGSRF